MKTTTKKNSNNHLLRQLTLGVLLVIFIVFPLGVQATVLINYGGECCSRTPPDLCCPGSPFQEPTNCINEACGPSEGDQGGTCQRVCIDSNGQTTRCSDEGEIQCIREEAGVGDGEVADSEEQETAVSTTSSNPDPTIRIPGLEFDNPHVAIVDGKEYVEIPWMADYIVAVYKVSVFFGAILATIMMMIGGLQWLMSGGNASTIGSAKKRIADALLGLILLLGSYLVLTTINPDLSRLNPISIPKVVTDPYSVKNVLHNTTENTAGPLRVP